MQKIPKKDKVIDIIIYSQFKDLSIETFDVYIESAIAKIIHIKKNIELPTQIKSVGDI